MAKYSARIFVASTFTIILSSGYAASLMHPSSFGLNLTVYGLPQILFLSLCILGDIKPALLLGNALGISTVAALESFWEFAVYTGANSMPAFVYLFLCIPLAIMGSLIAVLVVRKLSISSPIPQTTTSFILLASFGCSPFIYALLHQA